MYDKLMGPPPEWEEETENYCQECGSDNIFTTKTGETICRDCWFKDESEAFNLPVRHYRIELKSKEL